MTVALLIVAAVLVVVGFVSAAHVLLWVALGLAVLVVILVALGRWP